MDGSPRIIHCKWRKTCGSKACVYLLTNAFSDEHYRRSPGCTFFAYAKPPGKKTKSRKTRSSSKSWRLSSQSAGNSVASDTSMMDLDDGTDHQSIISQPPATTTTTTTKTKAPKKRQPKSKARKGKKVAAVDNGAAGSVDGGMDMDEPPKPKRTTKGKKRLSDLIDEGDELDLAPSVEEEGERPVKRKAIKSRAGAAVQSDNVDTEMEDASMEEANALHEEKPTKKNRKSKKNPSLKDKKEFAHVPRDSGLGNALDDGLEGDNTDDQDEANGQKASNDKPSAARRSKTIKEEPASSIEKEQELEGRQVVSENEPPAAEKKKPSKSARNQRSKKESRYQEDNNGDARNTQSSSQADPSVEIAISDQPQEPNRGVKAPRNCSPVNKKEDKQSDKLVQSGSTAQEVVAKDTGRSGSVSEKPDEQNDSNVHGKEKKRVAWHRSSRGPPKTVERYSDLPQNQHFADSVAKSPLSTLSHRIEEAHMHVDQTEAMAPFAASAESSPQSSDAENRPPSMIPSKPSAPNNATLSPTMEQASGTPIASTTPSPSKRMEKARVIQSSRPWAPLDIDSIINGNSSDKENDNEDDFMVADGGLSSPEKRMTVEEWINWNAAKSHDRLLRESEKMVMLFENEGARAVRALESIETID